MDRIPFTVLQGWTENHEVGFCPPMQNQWRWFCPPLQIWAMGIMCGGDFDCIPVHIHVIDSWIFIKLLRESWSKVEYLDSTLMFKTNPVTNPTWRYDRLIKCLG